MGARLSAAASLRAAGSFEASAGVLLEFCAGTTNINGDGGPGFSSADVSRLPGLAGTCTSGIAFDFYSDLTGSARASLASASLAVSLSAAGESVADATARIDDRIVFARAAPFATLDLGVRWTVTALPTGDATFRFSYTTMTVGGAIGESTRAPTTLSGVLHLVADADGVFPAVIFAADLRAGSSPPNGTPDAFLGRAVMRLDLPAEVTFTSDSGAFYTSPVPEPSTWLTALAGLARVGTRLRARRPDVRIGRFRPPTATGA